MTDLVTKKKWDKAAKNFDFMAAKGPERRWAGFKKELFSNMDGKVLFLAVGTGLDIQNFPSGKDITGIDISSAMLEKAKNRADTYEGNLDLIEMDVHDMPFEDNSFDQVYTSCTFCSVPNPVKGLESLKRVLKPGGEIRMFEHTGSKFFPFNLLMDIMTPLSKKVGPDMNRNTVGNVELAGFEVLEVDNLFLDVVKTITARKPL
ncbi:MAG: methyltransferase domain-containing protein [Gammaproteobacteria bacterium]|nr:methyltransferase domain-containing protein [Gammaproteobacteria bacterium]